MKIFPIVRREVSRWLSNMFITRTIFVPDRFNIDVQQIDLYVFDAAGCFLKCITRKGTPFPKDFRIDPELSAGSYTLVAWGKLD